MLGFWPSVSVGWTTILYTKSFSAQSPVRAHTYLCDQSPFGEHYWIIIIILIIGINVSSKLLARGKEANTMSVNIRRFQRQSELQLLGRARVLQRFQTIHDIQENTIGQLMVTGRTVWGPKVPTLKGTEASLYIVQCFSYLVSSSINFSMFHIIWLDPFWITYISIFIYVYTHVHVMYN